MNHEGAVKNGPLICVYLPKYFGLAQGMRREVYKTYISGE